MNTPVAEAIYAENKKSNIVIKRSANIYAHAVQQANENALNSVAALLETA